MSTTVETETMDDLFRIVERANERLAKMGVQRIITTVNIDLRLDEQISMESKLSASKRI
ncbi:Thiamine-binding protein [uncultured archaeon]|nr:Thiamine-binding protein [uncultured archaeon]